MTTTEIVERAIANGRLSTGGKTPDATLAAILYRHLQEGWPWNAFHARAKTGVAQYDAVETSTG